MHVDNRRVFMIMCRCVDTPRKQLPAAAAALACNVLLHVLGPCLLPGDEAPTSDAAAAAAAAAARGCYRSTQDALEARLHVRIVLEQRFAAILLLASRMDASGAATCLQIGPDSRLASVDEHQILDQSRSVTREQVARSST